jgi:uncharacterized protein YidB (DUF937 family)
VFPLRKKRPIKGSRGFKDAVAGPDEIRDLWARYPGADGVGIATGSASGFWVLDVDTKDGHAGDETLFDLEGGHGSLPPTVQVVSGSGGMHYYFSYDPAVNGSAGTLGDGLDVRSDGGYIVAPGSCHDVSPRLYEFEVEHLPGDVPLAVAPEWLVALASSARAQDAVILESGELAAMVERMLSEGWTELAPSRGRRRFARPGVDHESASWYPADASWPEGRLHVFTSSLPEGSWLDQRTYGARSDGGGSALLHRLEAHLANEASGGDQPSGRGDGVPGGTSGGAPGSPPSRATSGGRYQPTSLGDLYAMPIRFEWLIKGFWAAGSYGQIAGAKKTLKSHLATLMAISVAGGVPLLGTYDVPTAGRVLYYVGEGGKLPWRQRFDRLARASGISDPKALPVHPVFGVGPILGAEFREQFEANLREIQPSLVILDPLYAYHGASVKASDLHQEGALLNALSAPCQEFGSALVVVNHFNRSGTGTDLDSITQAGSGEWVDSWVLLKCLENSDVTKGQFHLRAAIGSRQWGGKVADIYMDLGAFDDDTGEHVGRPSWSVCPSTGTFKKLPKGANLADTKVRILNELVGSNGRPLAKTELYDRVKGNRGVFSQAIGELADSEQITVKNEKCRGAIKFQITPGPSYYRVIGAQPPTEATLDVTGISGYTQEAA